jgi:hypothetical protein
MVVYFRDCGISRGARKLARTPTLIQKKIKIKSLINIKIPNFPMNITIRVLFRRLMFCVLVGENHVFFFFFLCVEEVTCDAENNDFL